MIASIKGADLGFKNKDASRRQAIIGAFEEALDALIAPVEVYPLRCAQAHYDRIHGVGIGRFYKIFPSEPAVVRESERIYLLVATRHLPFHGRGHSTAAVFGQMNQLRTRAPEGENRGQ